MKEKITELLLLLAAIFTVIAILSAKETAIPSAATPIGSSLSSEVIRLHILADSDTAEAQRVKLVVRDALLPYLNALTMTAASREEALHTLSEHCNELNQIIGSVLEQEHAAYPSSVELTSTYFPIRIYGSQTFLSKDAVIFPPGLYDTVEVRLGNAEGHNWWCLAYPSLCFIDASYDYLPKESAEYLSVFSTLPKSRLNTLFYGGFGSLKDDFGEASLEEVDIVIGSRLFDFFSRLFSGQ